MGDRRRGISKTSLGGGGGGLYGFPSFTTVTTRLSSFSPGSSIETILEQVISLLYLPMRNAPAIFPPCWGPLLELRILATTLPFLTARSSIHRPHLSPQVSRSAAPR